VRGQGRIVLLERRPVLTGRFAFDTTMFD